VANEACGQYGQYLDLRSVLVFAVSRFNPQMQRLRRGAECWWPPPAG